MQRNLLSARHLFLQVFFLGCILATLTSCADMKSSEWKPTSPSQQTQQVPAQPTPDAPIVAQPVPALSKVALLLPLSGKGAETGQAMLNAAQLAMFDLNASSFFELRPEDTGKGAILAMNNAVANGANLVIGPVFSNDTKSVTPIALQNNVHVVSFSTDTSAAVGNTFLMGFMPQAQVNSVLSFARAGGRQNIALIAPRDVYGDSVTSTYSMFMQRLGQPVAGNIIRYTPKSIPSAQDIAMLNPATDAVLIAAPAAESNQISNALAASGFPVSTVRRLGTGLWDQVEAQSLTGLQGGWYAASSPKLRTRFETRYRETYGATPPRLASLAYDATALAVVLAKSGHGFNRQTLANPNGFSGIDGIFRFTQDGLADRGLAILEINNGVAHIIQDAPTRFGVIPQ